MFLFFRCSATIHTILSTLQIVHGIYVAGGHPSSADNGHVVPEWTLGSLPSPFVDNNACNPDDGKSSSICNPDKVLHR